MAVGQTIPLYLCTRGDAPGYGKYGLWPKIRLKYCNRKTSDYGSIFHWASSRMKLPSSLEYLFSKLIANCLRLEIGLY